jgi:hypothetical protein
LYKCEKHGKRILAVSQVKNIERENTTTGKWKKLKSRQQGRSDEEGRGRMNSKDLWHI